VITGATRLEQLEENLGAAELAEKLDNEILENIEAILDNHPDD
jgi:aryl-alcohol dehydrogenase-like predicted oxidoreductase